MAIFFLFAHRMLRAGMLFLLTLVTVLPMAVAHSGPTSADGSRPLLLPVALPGSNRDICSGQNTTLGVNNPTPGLTYSWSPTTNLSNPTIHNPLVQLTNTTGGTVPVVYTLTVTDATGATASASVTIRVLSAPIVNPGRDSTVCSGQTITLGTPGIAGYTYSWPTSQQGFTLNTSNTIAQPSYTFTNPNTASFFRNLVLMVRAPNGCTVTTSVRITVEPAVVADAGPDLAQCAGSTITLGAPDVPGYSYVWSPVTGLSNPNVAQPTLTLVNTGTMPITTTYTVTVSIGACSNTDQVTTTVYPAPTANAGAPVTVCVNKPTQLAATVAPVAGTTYRWAPTTGLSNPNILSPTLTLPTAGAFTYTLTATNVASGSAACAATNTVAVTVTPLPVAQATATPGVPVVLCSGQTRNLGVGPGATGVTYRWRPTTGLAAPTAASSAITLTNLTAAPRTAVYTLIATAAAGCVDSSQVTVIVNPPATVRAGPAVALCTGATATLGTPALPGYTYSWSPATALSSATAAQPTVTATNATAIPILTKYYVTATQGGPNGCSARDSVVVTANPAPAAPIITGSGFVCDFSQTQQYSVPAVAGAAYQWTAVGGTVSAGQGTAQATIQFAAGGIGYAVRVVQTSALGCAGAVGSLAVSVDNRRLTLTVASVDVASNSQITLGLAVVGTTTTASPVQVMRRIAGQGSFVLAGTVASTATSFTDSGVDAATNSYEYRLDLTNACNQTTSNSALAQTVRLAASNAGTTGAGGRDQGSTTLQWNPYVGFPVQEYRLFRSLDGGPFETLPSVSGTTLLAVVPNGMGGTSGAGRHQQFRVVAVSAATPPVLANSNTSSVDFAGAVRSYNIITPNNDNLNETLVIDNIALYPGHSFTIFNRWGREVYTTTNYQNNWGNDPSVAPGVYFYVLNLPDGTRTKGWVEVMK